MKEAGQGGGTGSHLLLPRTHRDEVSRGVTVMTEGRGVHVFDRDGKQYLDMVSGVTRPVHVGYGRQELAQAGYDQMLKMAYFTPMQYSNEPAERLAERLAAVAPGEINRFFFVCDGSEAVESAIKMARHFHEYRGGRKRFKVVARRGAYHGVTGNALRSLGTVLPMRQIMEPLGPGAVFVESPYCYRCPYHLSYPACDLLCARDVARIIEFEGPDLVSAFIGEPIQQGFGALSPPPEYWPIIREICDRYGVLLIIDEVICGFGRTGKWFGHEHFEVKADLMTMAKGISSGYVPLGGMGCTDTVADAVDVFQHLHTYTNHPVSCAVALKNLEILEGEGLIDHAREMGAYFLEALGSLSGHACVGQVRGIGLWTALDLTLDRASRAAFPADALSRLVDRARARGLIIKCMGPALEFAPPLIIQREDIDRAVSILDECLSEEEQALGL